MQKIIRTVFITRPMTINYISTLVLNLSVLLFLCYLMLFEHNMIDLNWYKVFTFIYLIIVFIFVIHYRKDYTINLGTYSEQLKVDFKPSLPFYVIKSFLISLYYILTNIFIVSLIEKILNNNFFEKLNVFIPYISISISILIFVLALMRIIFELTKISPFILLGFIIIPLLMFSFIGIEKAILGWTFLAMSLGMIANQFLSMDLRHLVPEKFKIFIKNEEELEGIINKKKYTLIVFIPILYVSLLISEKIMDSDPYIYMINAIHSKHFQSVPTDYFSEFLIWNAFLKLLIVLVAWACFQTGKDWIFETLSMKLLDVNISLNDISLKNGKYNLVKFKRLNNKWKINENHYFYLAGNVIIERKLEKNIHNIYNISDNLLLSEKGRREIIKYVSNDILKIGDDFFVLDKSDSQSEISDSNRQVGLNILKINHYTIWSILFLFIFMFLILTMLITCSMKNSYRGEYVYNISGDINKPNFDNNDKILFCKEDIYIIKTNKLSGKNDIVSKYRYDDVTLTIKNSKGERIGEIESNQNNTYSQKLIVIHDGNIKKKYYYKLLN